MDFHVIEEQAGETILLSMSSRTWSERQGKGAKLARPLLNYVEDEEVEEARSPCPELRGAEAAFPAPGPDDVGYH